MSDAEFPMIPPGKWAKLMPIFIGVLGKLTR